MATKKPTPVYLRQPAQLDFEAGEAFLQSLEAKVDRTPPAPGRNAMAVANDTVIELANAAAGGVKSAAEFISPGNRVSRFIDEEIIKPGEAAQSDVTRQSREQFEREVQAADGVSGELAAVGGKIMRDPMLTMAQAFGSLAIPGALVKGAGGAARMLGMGSQGVARAGLAGGATAGAALAGGDAAGTAYELVIRAGGSPEQAEQAAREASVIPAAVGGAGGLVGAERLLAGAGGARGGAVSRALKTGAVEGLQEGVEEGVTQFEGQRAAVPYDPTIDPSNGVAAASGMGAAMGGAIGAGVGAFTQPVRSPGDVIRQQLQPEVGPTTRATNAGVEAVANMVDNAAGVTPVGISAEQEAAAMTAMEQQATADLQAIRAAGRADKTGLPPLPQRPAQVGQPIEMSEPAAPSADVVDAPLADRIISLREMLADERTRETVRSTLGPEGLQSALYYLHRADNAKDVPEVTRERMLALAEEIVSQSVLKPVDRPAPSVEPSEFGGPGQVGADGQPPAIAFDTTPTGRVRVDAAGNAAAETRADVIDSRNAAAAGLPQRPDGMEAPARKASAVYADPNPRRPAPAVTRAPRTQTVDAVLIDPSAPTAVRRFVDRLRTTNTPAARAFVKDFEAGRISPEDVASLMAPRAAPTADERIAAAAALAPQPDTGLILNPNGDPFPTKGSAILRAKKEGGTVVEFLNGYAVRAKAAAAPPAAPAPQRAADAAARAAPATGEPAGQPAPVSGPGEGAGTGSRATAIAGSAIDSEWTAFAPASGTLGVPRAQMPQVKAEHRGAMVNFLTARGITHEQDAEVDPTSLKPTQAEFSPGKVAKAREFTGGDRSILVSGDGHVLDGHHQWMKHLEDGTPVKVIRLDAPIDKLLAEVKEFPSAGVADGATSAAPEAAPVRPDASTAPVVVAATDQAPVKDAARPGAGPAADTTPADQDAIKKREPAPSREAVTEPGDTAASERLASPAGAPVDSDSGSAASEPVASAPPPGAKPVPAEPEQALSLEERWSRMTAAEREAAGKSAGLLHLVAKRTAGKRWENIPDTVRTKIAGKMPATNAAAPAAELQTAMEARGWAAEVAGDRNTIWTKRVGPERYTAILRPAVGSKPASMEVTALVDTVDTQIDEFTVTSADDAAALADRAVAEDTKAVPAPRVLEAPRASATPAPGERPAAFPETDAVAARARLKAKLGAAPPAAPEPARLTDAGEELIRNRRGKLKGLAWEDVSAMNDTLKVAQVVKSNVWPRPDYAKMVEEGAPAWKAAVLKAVYDKLAAAPVTRTTPTDADLKAYIETLAQVRETLAAELDRVEKLGAAGELWKTLKAGNVFGKVFPVPADAKPVYGAPSAFDRNSEQGKDNNRRAQLIGGNGPVQALQFSSRTLIKVRDLLADGFPAKQEAWQKSYEVRATETRDSDVPAAERTGESQQRFYVYDKGSSWRLAKGGQDGGYATQEQAEAFASTLTARKRETLPPSRGLDLADATRTGPDWRDGKDVTADQVMEHFGFRGVNLGEYVKAKQGVAQLHLNHVFDAFSDLADLLGVPPKAMSLNGTLGVAIGAQGSGKALAHFVPGVNEINITRDSGAGALAHEFGHAVDHYFATQHGRAASMAKRPYLSAVVETMREPGGVRPEVVEAMRAVMKTINARPMSEAEVRKYMEDQRTLNQRRMDRWVTEFKGNKGADAAALAAVGEKLKGGDVGEVQDGDVETNLAEFMRAAGLKPGNAIAANAFTTAYRLRDLADEARFMASHIPQVDTDYAKASAAMDAKKPAGEGYWSTPWEKFARAFETFAMDALKDRERESLYLSGLVDSAGWRNWSEETGKAIPYPAGAERLEMQQAFQKLVDTIETRQDDVGNVAMFSRGGDPKRIADLEAHADWVRLIADRTSRAWKEGPAVVVATDISDLVVPEAIQRHAAGQDSRGATGTVAATFYDGQVFLFADQLATAEAVQEALFHEVLGHFGLRGAFPGSGLDTVLDRMAILQAGKVRAKAKQYGLDMEKVRERRAAAEEVLADLAQLNPELGWVQKAIAAIRTWLREHVPSMAKLRLTDAEVIRSFILPARGFVERGRQAARGGDQVPAFSRGTAAPTDAGEPFGVANKATNVLSHYRGMAMRALGRRQIIELWSKEIPALRTYGDLVQRMDAEKNETAAEADELADRWGKLPDERALAELMHDATMAHIDADPQVQPDAEADPAAVRRLRAAFNALTPDAQATYRKARTTYAEHHERVRQAIRERIERSELSSERRKKLLERMDDEFFTRVRGVYFPLSRFGPYVVVVRDGAGDAVVVSRGETINEAEGTRAQLLKDYPAAKGFRVGKVIKDRAFNAARDGVGRGFMAELFDALEKQGAEESLQDAIGQLYLASLPDLSWAKHGIHRKGTPGFSQDARRAFAQNVFHGARYLARLRYADRLQSQIEAMQRHVDRQRDAVGFDSIKAQQVVDEMVERHDTLMNPKSHPLSTALTSFGFIFHLGLSPASALVNLLQTALVALPQMAAKWGYAKTSAALLKASQEAATNRNDMGQVLEGDELAAYDAAVKAGVIDITQANDLAGIAQGEDARVAWRLRPVMKAASFLFHHAERFNRQVTFVAAYRLAREGGVTHTAAYEQAVQATYDGHFDYSASNRPRIMQGNIAKVVLLFKQYAQNMIWTLSRQAYLSMKAQTPEGRHEAQKALGGLLALHAAAAGSLGLPLVGPLLAAASMLGSSDDEPWDAETALKNMLADELGPKASEVIAHGLSRLTPWDISGRVGLDRLILPDVQEGLEGARLAESWATAALGPVAGIGVNVMKGLQLVGEGRAALGLETMMPAALRGPMKALRYGTEGAVDKSGVSIKDEVDAAALAGQALGFSPSEVRLATEGKSAIYRQDSALQERRQRLLALHSMAVMAGDEEAAAETREEIQGFNEKNPDRRIGPVHLRASVLARRKRIEESEQGVYLPKSRRDALEAGRFAVPVD